MARYAWGTTLASFYRNQTDVVEVTTAGHYDSTYVTNAINCTGSGFIRTMPFVDAASPTTIWIHAEVSIRGANNSANRFMTFLNSTGGHVIVIDSTTSNGTFQAYYWNGSGYTTLGASFSLTTGFLAYGTRFRLDVKVVAGASGAFEIYSSGTLVHSASFSDTDVNNFAGVNFHAAYSGSGGASWSQILVASYDTRDSRYSNKKAAAAGGATDGSGSASDINETVLDETTAAALSTTALRRSWTHDAFTVPVGYQIACTTVSGRGRTQGTGPADGYFMLRGGGNNYLSTALSLAAAYEPRGRYWELDPVTAVAFTQTSVNNIELGIAS